MQKDPMAQNFIYIATVFPLLLLPFLFLHIFERSAIDFEHVCRSSANRLYIPYRGYISYGKNFVN